MAWKLMVPTLAGRSCAVHKWVAILLLATRRALIVACAELEESAPRALGKWPFLPVTLGYQKVEISEGWGTPESAIGVKKHARQFDLYVPQCYHLAKADPLFRLPYWIVAPGTNEKGEDFFFRTGLKETAEQRCVAMGVLESEKIWGSLELSVGNQAQALGFPFPDDVAYTKAVLRESIKRLRVDTRHIHCVGFSRGARFCSRLASELSNFIAGIATVSGVRFPWPNNATKPVPVIAFHGTADTTNPFQGGGAHYWGEGVAKVVERWADYDKCEKHINKTISPLTTLDMYVNCQYGTKVMLYTLKGGEHKWVLPQYLDVKDAIWQFFRDMPDRSPCHTAVLGEHCHRHLAWARDHGIKQMPELYPGLSKHSTLEEFQTVLRELVYANCPRPCAAPTSTSSSTTTLTTSTSTVTTMTRTTITTTSSTTEAGVWFLGLADGKVESAAGWFDGGYKQVATVSLGLMFVAALSAVPVLMHARGVDCRVLKTDGGSFHSVMLSDFTQREDKSWVDEEMSSPTELKRLSEHTEAGGVRQLLADWRRI